MTKPPSFQFFPRDWIVDTRRMTREQRCRYHDALCESWIAESYGVATEDQWRAWMEYSPEEWAEVRAVFVPRFRIRGSLWTQVRLKTTREEQASRYESSRAAGEARSASMSPEERKALASKAAKQRWNKNGIEQGDMLAPASGMPPPASASASASAVEEKTLHPGAAGAGMANGVDHANGEQLSIGPGGEPDPTWLECFDRLWIAVYPHFHGRPKRKGKALKAWKKIKPQTFEHFERVAAYVIRLSSSEAWKRKDGEYVPNLENFLDDQPWLETAT